MKTQAPLFSAFPRFPPNILPNRFQRSRKIEVPIFSLHIRHYNLQTNFAHTLIICCTNHYTIIAFQSSLLSHLEMLAHWLPARQGRELCDDIQRSPQHLLMHSQWSVFEQKPSFRQCCIASTLFATLPYFVRTE